MQKSALSQEKIQSKKLTASYPDLIFQNRQKSQPFLRRKFSQKNGQHFVLILIQKSALSQEKIQSKKWTAFRPYFNSKISPFSGENSVKKIGQHFVLILIKKSPPPPKV